MKRLLYLILILPLLLINCNKETSIEPLSDAKITAAINGTSMDFEFKSAEFFYGDFRILAEIGEMSLTIYTEQFSIGEYLFGIDQFNEAILYESGDNSLYFSSNCFNSNTGSISISSIDSIEKTFSGSFHFDGCNSSSSPDERSISNGVFSDLKYSASNLGGEIRGKLKFKQDNKLIAFRDVLCTGDTDKFSANAFLINGKSFQIEFEKPNFDGNYDINDLENFSASLDNSEGNCHYLAESGNITYSSTSNGPELNFNLQLKNQCNGKTIALTDGVLHSCP